LGYADVYYHKDEIPSIFNYEQTAQAGLHNNRLARLTLVPNKKGAVFASVYSFEGAKFDIWAFASAEPLVTSSFINSVSKHLRGWEILGNHCDEDLHMKLPAIVLEAKGIVEFETKMAKPSILAELTLAKEEAATKESELVVDQDDDDIAIMDRFVAKAGRKLLRKALVADAEGHHETNDFDGDDETLQNPNAHPSLFIKPKLQTEKSFLEIVRAEKLLSQETEKFSLEHMTHSTNLSVRRSASDSLVLPKITGSPIRKKEATITIPRYSLTRSDARAIKQRK